MGDRLHSGWGWGWGTGGLIGGVAGVTPFDFDPALVTFTAGMAKRTGKKAFAAAPIVQGDPNNADALTDDVLSLSRGSQVSGNFYDNFDGTQGTIVLWWTPEYSYDDLSGAGQHSLYYFENDIHGVYDYANDRFLFYGTNGLLAVVNSNVVAGTTYCIAVRWDCNNTLDGSNYMCASINDSHTFRDTGGGIVQTPSATMYIGTKNTTLASSGIIEGFTVYRRVLFDGTYGVDVGNGDEIAAIYAAGAGQDPCLVTGSWDVVFCMPTDSSVGPLVTGTGEIHSHPHSSNLIPGNSNAGGFMMDGTYGNDGWSDEGTPTAVAALATAEKIFPGGYKVTSDAANEGIYQDITVSAGDDVVIQALGHSDGTSVPKCILYDQDNGAEIASRTGTTGSTRTAPDVFEFSGEAPAGCTTIRVKLINTDATAAHITYWHQANVQANLWNDPGMEAGTAPTNVGTPTTSAQDAGQAHSDTNSWKIVADAADEGIKRAITTTSGKFYHASAWIWADTAGTVDMEGPTLQDGTTTKVTTTTNDAWERLEFVFRATAASTDLQFTSNAAQTFYVDDVAVYELDDVSVTVTPASEANSTETSGLRGDGGDTITQSQTETGASWEIRWDWTQRHAAADVAKFGETAPYILDAYEDANNYCRVYWSAANTVTVALNNAGAGEQTNNWDATGAIAAGTTYTGTLTSNGASLILAVDGTDKCTVSSAPASVDALDLNWGCDNAGENQLDATFAAPTP